MSTSRAPDGELDVSDNGASETDAPVQSCPNCGRDVVGNYCPECGHEVDRELSATEVIGGFFREFVDVERGFWATLKALTLRPGSALRTYLSGVRGRLMSPGRYLLAAIVICYATDRTLTWIGVRASLASQAPDPAGDVPPVVREIQRVTWHVFESQSIRIAVNVVLAGLVAVVLWRLFQGILDRGAEALALGGFLVGHTVILEAAAKLLYAPAVYLSTGQPAQFAYLLYLGLTTVYIGWALYDWLGTNWRPVAKGMFGLAVAYVDMAAILTIAPLGYGLWLIQMAPETYAQPEGIAVGFSLAALLAAVPLLIHAGLEAYVRLR